MTQDELLKKEKLLSRDTLLIKKINEILNKCLEEEKVNPNIFIYPKSIGEINAVMINAGRRETA